MLVDSFRYEDLPKIIETCGKDLEISNRRRVELVQDINGMVRRVGSARTPCRVNDTVRSSRRVGRIQDELVEICPDQGPIADDWKCWQVGEKVSGDVLIDGLQSQKSTPM